MKKVNLLSKAEMKKVIGGAGPCDEWYNSSNFGTCFNCCLAYEITQPRPVDPEYSSHVACDGTCSR